MPETSDMSSFDHTPVYTIKTVVQVTGITPATLRAWERRYGILSPERSEGGYRLYSEHDIATLLWLKSQVDASVSISRAVAILQLRRQGGEHPELEMSLGGLPNQAGSVTSDTARSAEAIAENLLSALLTYHEAAAAAVLSEAFALYPVETVAEEIVKPVLVEIGERWHRGEATITQEHFATAFLRRQVASLFQAYDQPGPGPLAIVGSAPSEWHDVGALLVAVTLRRHGWRVLFLGQNVPVDHLVREISHLRPDLVCMSATSRESALALIPLAEAMSGAEGQHSRLVVGGRAFNQHPELRERFPGVLIATTARSLIPFLVQS
jgi:MerR family transcriptional regulator, light-induced transcriptional regulator